MYYGQGVASSHTLFVSRVQEVHLSSTQNRLLACKRLAREIALAHYVLLLCTLQLPCDSNLGINLHIGVTLGSRRRVATRNVAQS